MTGFGPKYRALDAERNALLQRVTVLERALERIDTTIAMLGNETNLDWIQETARKALNGLPK